MNTSLGLPHTPLAIEDQARVFARIPANMHGLYMLINNHNTLLTDTPVTLWLVSQGPGTCIYMYIFTPAYDSLVYACYFKKLQQ